MLYEVFFDADVIMSGSFSKTGASFQLLLLSELSLICGVTCKKVVQECERNIQKKLPAATEVFRHVMTTTLTVVENPSKSAIKEYQTYAHPKDLCVLVAALKNQIRFFVTFNKKHFHPPEKENIQIFSPSEMLHQIRQDIYRN